MPVIVQDAREYRFDRAWGARDLATIEGASVRLHWADRPYEWHVNDGAELFCVIEGTVEMRYRSEGAERSVLLTAGDMFIAEQGDEHVAQPRGEARILVVERKGSI